MLSKALARLLLQRLDLLHIALNLTFQLHCHLRLECINGCVFPVFAIVSSTNPVVDHARLRMHNHWLVIYRGWIHDDWLVVDGLVVYGSYRLVTTAITTAMVTTAIATAVVTTTAMMPAAMMPVTTVPVLVLSTSKLATKDAKFATKN